MATLNVNDLLTYHEYWRKVLPEDKANKYIDLSRKLMHKVIDCEGIISGITLTYPEDCSDYHVFYDFLEIVGHYSLDSNKTTITATFL